MQTMNKYRCENVFVGDKNVSDLLVGAMGIFQYVDLHVWTNGNA